MPAKAKHAPLIRNCQTLERWPVIRDAFERQREETKEKRHQGRPVQQPSSTTEPDPDPVDTVQLSIRPFGAGVTAAFKKQLDGATELSVSVPRKATKARHTFVVSVVIVLICRVAGSSSSRYQRELACGPKSL